MPKTKYKIIPPEEGRDAPPMAQQFMKFECGDCGKEIFGYDLVDHAEKEHHANSVMVDTTINWGEIARKSKEQEDQ
ncbi:MAG: hypothetical protein BWY50_02030 [Spirochaetes bacterium ADurb.Bin315]|nr:MAG: hypothetical protein BWY50_02030 [Spirochaetes bacterium ADurb.Bin315]